MSKSFVQLDIRKGILGLLLGLAVFVIGSTLSAPISSALLALGFVLFGFLRINFRSPLAKLLCGVFWTAAILVATWFSTLTVINSVVWLETTQRLFNLNALCMLLVCGGLFVLTANWSASLSAGAVVLELLCTANGFIYQFRGKELLSFDVFSFATALNVAEQYSASVSAMMFFGWALWGLALFAQFSFPLVRSPKNTARTRAVSLIAVLSLSLFLFSASSDVQTELWDTRGSVVNGYHLNFLLSIRDSAVKKPQGYDPKTLPQESTPVDIEGPRPNVIVIMNEAFSDFRVFGGPLNTNIPVLPYYDSIMDECIHGYALASIFGGNTSNSEFEFLTGHTMTFLPAGSVAYQQFIQGRLFALPHLMNSYGYKSIATHPYYANGWSRKRNYPILGFSESTFIDSYPNQNLLRTYISDQEMYEFMINRLNQETKSPLFFFGVSMQNHGGYNYTGEEFVKTVSLTDYPDRFPLAEQYLSSLHASDSALEYLIENLRNSLEDTIVLLFGDHLPRVETELFEALCGGPLDTLDEQMRQYSVPFFIWANFDLDAREIEHTGLNYLSSYLLEAAGLPLSPYHKALKTLSETVPALNPMGYYSAEQDKYLPFEEASQEDADALNLLAFLQYNNLFDPSARSFNLFDQYLPN